MYSYSLMQWILFFYIYCFIGWCFESTYVSVKQKKFINRGFMRGPVLPLYGSGAMVILFITAPIQNNIGLLFIAGFFGATLLEYVTGVTMEALFKVRYWDYSNVKLNFQGQICLSSSLAWGVLTIIMAKYIHKPIEKMVLSMPDTILNDVTFFLTILVVADFAVAFKAAIDLRELLIKMEKAKEELVHLQKRLDFIMAMVDDKKSDLVDGLEEKVSNIRESELIGNIEERFEKLKQKMQMPEAYSVRLENFKDEINDMFVKIKLHREETKERSNGGSWYTRIVLRNNPMMKSGKYAAALEELMHSLDKKKSGDNSDETKED